MNFTKCRPGRRMWVEVVYMEVVYIVDGSIVMKWSEIGDVRKLKTNALLNKGYHLGKMELNPI